MEVSLRLRQMYHLDTNSTICPIRISGDECEIWIKSDEIIQRGEKFVEKTHFLAKRSRKNELARKSDS